jgi:filamentous hemagglutinin family protein
MQRLQQNVGKKSAFPKLKLLATTIACIITSGHLHADGIDPWVVSGQASFSAQGSLLNVTNTPGAIIHWQDFSIAAGDTTHFQQESAASSVLNRVTGANASSIFGTLSSNGQVFLINPSGILFGQGSQIDVAGLVASTLDISNNDFRAGLLNFQANDVAADTHNQGHISTPSGGVVYLLGNHVSNSGLISSAGGDVILAAGKTISIMDTSSPGVRVELTGDDSVATNIGEIVALSGDIGIYGAVLRNSGTVNADQVSRDQNGRITLRAKHDITLSTDSNISADGETAAVITVQSESGTTLVNGSLSARGTSADSTGGQIYLLGDRVGLLDSEIDVSGSTGGGTVLIGGDYLGRNTTIQNADRSYVSADTTINADATTAGNGGKVIVWADDFTRFAGHVSARGGEQSGNGGFVETSGKLNLEVLGGSVDTRAPNGQAGTWLMDPSNVNITNAPITGAIAGGIFTPSQDTAILNNLVLSTALETGNVNVTTTNPGGTQGGTITVSAPVTRAAGTGTTTLTLTPDQITGGTITVAGGGSISGSAGSPLNVSFAASGVGATVAIGAPITTFGGNVSSTGTTFTNLGGTINTSGTGTGGNITLDHTTTMTLPSPLISGGGNINIAGGSTYTGTSTINAGAGTLTLRGNTPTLTIGIGSTTGTFAITNAQIQGMTTTGGLIFGQTSGTGAITLGTNEAVNFGTKNVTVQQATGGITVIGSAVSGSGSMSFVAGTGTFTNNSQVITNGAVNITADLLALNADIVGTGQLTITPFTKSLAIETGLTPTAVKFGPGGLFNTTLVASNAGRVLKIGDKTHTGDITVIGAYNPGAQRIELVTGGDVRINAGGVTSPNIVVAGRNFFNQFGAAALTATTGRWLVYSNDPALNTFGGLNSNQLALWGRSYSANPPASITDAGNRYLFTRVPQLTATVSSNFSKVYGTDLTASAPAVSVTGLVNAASFGSVFLQDSLGGSPTASSAGFAATAPVAGSPFAISVSGITAPAGYGATITNNGQVTVTPFVINLNASRQYDGTVNMPGSFLGAGNLVGSQTLTLTGVGTVADRNVGTGKPVTPGTLALGNGSNGGIASNYTLIGGTHVASITPAQISFGSNTVVKVYDGNVNASGSAFISTGALFGSDSFTGGNLAFADKNVGIGNKQVIISGVTINDGNGGANYNIGYTQNSTSTISPFVVSLNGSRQYDGTLNMPGSILNTSALVGTETLTVSGTGTITNGGAGTNKPIAPGSLVLGNGSNGGLASNYTLSGGTHLASILGVLLDVSANNATKVYDSTAWTGGNGVTYSGFLAGDTQASLNGTLVYSGTSQGAINTGTYGIMPGGLTSSNYILNFVGGTLNVTPAMLGIAANSVVNIYSGLGWVGGNGVTYSGFKGTDSPASLTGALVYGGSSQGVINAGNYSIIPGGLSSPNYTIAYANGNLIVAPASLGIIADNATKGYGDSLSFVGNEFRSNGLKNAETIGQVTLVSSGANPVASVDGSPYDIIVMDARGGTFNPANYDISYFFGELEVIPAELLGITANSAVKIYDGLSWTGGNGVKYTGFRAGDTEASLTGSIVYGGSSQGAINTGTYTIRPSGQSSSNYTITYLDGRLIVAPASLGIVADSASKAYGDTFRFVGNEFRSTGLQNGETIASVTLASNGATALAPVGGSPYAITASNAFGGTFNPANYKISYFDGALAVTPSSLLAVAANSAVKVYNGLAWTGGNGVVYSGFRGTDSAANLNGQISYAGTSQGAVNVGNYSIVPFGQSSPNYTITYVDGNLAVTPATLAITALDINKNYGTATSFTGSEFRSTGLQNGETVGRVNLNSAGATAASGVANSPYPIVANNASGGSFSPANYQISYANGALRVLPIPLTVVADSHMKVYGTDDPLLSYSVTGLVNNAPLGVVDTQASVLRGELVRTPGESVVGSPYRINVGSLMSNRNYTLGFTPGNLVIAPVPEIFAGLVHHQLYYRPGNFWHISLSPSGADKGFDVMRGTGNALSRQHKQLNNCDSLTSSGFCETWAFPQQQESEQQ